MVPYDVSIVGEVGVAESRQHPQFRKVDGYWISIAHSGDTMVPHITPIMENQMEKKMENEMEAGII